MGRIKKLFNDDYIYDIKPGHLSVNINNKPYIDRFVSENYNRLKRIFRRSDINSSAYGSMDKLNETLLSLYTDSSLNFASWAEAEMYLTNKFTEKEKRININKPITNE